MKTKSSRSAIGLTIASVTAVVVASSCSVHRSDLARGVPSYKFIHDGKNIAKFIASMSGDDDPPRSGDVVQVGPFLLRVRDKRAYEIALDHDHESKYARRVVDRETGRTLACDAPTLLTISQRDYASLMGLRLNDWNDRIAEALTRLDTSQLAVVVTDDITAGAKRPRFSLPAATRILSVETSAHPGISLWGFLTTLPDLWFFRCRGYARSGPNFELAMLAKSTKLRVLDLDKDRHIHADVLRKFTRLHALSMPAAHGLESLGFVDAMPELRSLRVPGSGIDWLGMRRVAKHLRLLDISWNNIAEDFDPTFFPTLQYVDLSRYCQKLWMVTRRNARRTLGARIKNDTRPLAEREGYATCLRLR